MALLKKSDSGTKNQISNKLSVNEKDQRIRKLNFLLLCVLFEFYFGLSWDSAAIYIHRLGFQLFVVLDLLQVAT